MTSRDSRTRRARCSPNGSGSGCSRCFRRSHRWSCARPARPAACTGVSVTATEHVAVLASGGVDSAILVGHLSREGFVVHPVYVRFGLAWEPVEETHLRRFLGRIDGEHDVRPLVVLALPIADVYAGHWSTSGVGVPDDTTPDEAVYLPGRNLLLL